MPYSDPEAYRQSQAWHVLTHWTKTVSISRTPSSYLAALRRDPCAYCGSSGGTLDHIVPTAAGGETAWDNYTAACPGCNSSKKRLPLLAFLAVRPIRAKQVELEKQRREYLALSPERPELAYSETDIGIRATAQ